MGVARGRCCLGSDVAVKAGGVVFANETRLQQTGGRKASKSVALPLPENHVRIVVASDTVC